MVVRTVFQCYIFLYVALAELQGHRCVRSLLHLSQKGASSVKNALERQKRPLGVYQSFMFLKVCLSRVQLLVD